MKKDNTSAGKDDGQMRTLTPCWENTWAQLLWRAAVHVLTETCQLFDPAIPVLEIYAKEVII